jgi:hypothetical protein
MFNVITYLSHTDSEISVVLDDTLPVASLRTDFPFWEQRVTTSRRSKKKVLWCCSPSHRHICAALKKILCLLLYQYDSVYTNRYIITTPIHPFVSRPDSRCQPETERDGQNHRDGKKNSCDLRYVFP